MSLKSQMVTVSPYILGNCFTIKCFVYYSEMGGGGGRRGMRRRKVWQRQSNLFFKNVKCMGINLLLKSVICSSNKGQGEWSTSTDKRISICTICALLHLPIKPDYVSRHKESKVFFAHMSWVLVIFLCFTEAYSCPRRSNGEEDAEAHLSMVEF
jgi:hypothetical protein